MSKTSLLPVPSFFDENKAGELYQLDYAVIQAEAALWREKHNIEPAANDKHGKRVALLNIDCQITFVHEDFELPVVGAIQDMSRLSRMIHVNLRDFTYISSTFDTHPDIAIHLPRFWVDADGNHPAPHTNISVDDVANKVWQPSPDAIMYVAGGKVTWLMRYVEHYVQTLAERGRFELTIWPQHAQVGSLGWSQCPIVEEAIKFHAAVRQTGHGSEIKGGNPLTECYSVFGPEVLTSYDGTPIPGGAQKNTRFIEQLMQYDVVGIAGEAKSHCVAWTIADLLDQLLKMGGSDLVEKVHLIEDACSPVVVPGTPIDYTDEANKAFADFADAGMHIVDTSMPVKDWPGLN